MALLVVSDMAVPCALVVPRCLESYAYIYVVHYVSLFFTCVIYYAFSVMHAAFCCILMGFASWYFLFIHTYIYTYIYIHVFLLACFIWVLNQVVAVSTIIGTCKFLLSGLG